MESQKNSVRNKSLPNSKRESLTNTENLNIEAEIKHEFSQSTISNTQVNDAEYFSVYKSTEFYLKDIDEKIEVPIELRNLELNNKESSINSNRSTNPNMNSNFSNSSIFINDYSAIKNTIHLKNNYITNLNFFVQNYVNDICSLFNKIDSVVLKKITLILDKHKYFARFFKEITALYETFSINLIQANNTISLHFKDEDEASPYSQINETIDKTQELISNSFYDFSKNLQNKIIQKGPLSNFKIKEFYNKLGNISKDSNLFLSTITKKRDKIVMKFIQNEKLFEMFKKSFNDQDRLQSILSKNEFFLKEFEFCNSVNKLFDKIENFFMRYIQSLKELKELTNSFINSIKDTIEIYSSESKKMFLIEEMESMLENLRIGVENLNEARDILMDHRMNKIINDQLKIFQTNLIKFSFVKNEEIYNDEMFDINKYKNFEELINFLIQITPQKSEITNSNLLFYSCQLNKIYGIFKRSKKVTVAFTIQGSILIFEDKFNNKNLQKMCLKTTKFVNLEDRNYPLRFELSELQIGVIYNSTFRVILEAENSQVFKYIENIFQLFNK